MKNNLKMYMCIYIYIYIKLNHFAASLKLTQYYTNKSMIFQLKEKEKDS